MGICEYPGAGAFCARKREFSPHGGRIELATYRFRPAVAARLETRFRGYDMVTE